MYTNLIHTNRLLVSGSFFYADSAVTTESDSEETLSTSEGEGQREGSVGSENGFKHAVVTIQRKEEVRMKKTDLLSGSSLSEKRGEIVILQCMSITMYVLIIGFESGGYLLPSRKRGN